MTDFEPGDTLADKYRISAVLGEGGFGRVYLAETIGTGRQVAVKVLKSADARDAAVTESRFLRELKTIAQLHHPNTITLFDYGTSAGQLYMVCEYVRGEDLSELLERQERLTEAETIHVLRQVLGALGEAHAAGLLHRDIKPDNIRLTEYNGDPFVVKVLDFGIAKSLRTDDPSLTGTGQVIGTPRYMSPEQLCGAPLTPACDIYSLGLVAYEMLLGAAEGAARPVSRIGNVSIAPEQGVSAALCEVVNTMLHPLTQHRYRSTAQVLHALDAVGRQSMPQASHELPVPGRTEAVTQHVEAVQPTPAPSVLLTAPPERMSNQTLLRVLGLVGVLAVVCGVSLVVLFQQQRTEPAPHTVSQRNLQGILAAPQVTTPRVEHRDPPDVGERRDAPAVDLDGCGGSAAGLNDSRFMTYVPEGYAPSKRYPLLLVFPGLGVPAQQTMVDMSLRPFADEEGVVIVIPNIGPARWEGREDLVRAMAAQTRRALCIDPARIFALGHGGGGEGAELAACEPWLAAMATTSYRAFETEFPCADARAVRYLHLAPLKSGHLPIDGGLVCSGAWEVISLDDQEAVWRARNRCDGPARQFSKPRDGVCQTWDCDTQFVSCRIDGGHGWTRRLRVLDLKRCDGQAADFPYLETIWAFFSEQ